MAEAKNKTVEKEKPREDFTIQVRGVTKAFGPTVAVDNVSFNVPRGEVIGFLGPNGSGKSTTMRLITSYYTPDSGTIIIEGLDNQKHDVETRRMIGYLPENNPLYGDMLVHEYLKYVAELRGLSSGERRVAIEESVEQTGIEEVYYRPISQCSKGYKQRTGLAAAILHRPDILIMDEPTEGLDPNQRIPVRELIREVGRERTVMLSTHVLQEAREVCDRLLIIRRGHIVAEGTMADLQVKAQRERRVDVEVAGDGVEKALDRLREVESIVRHQPTNGRQRYTLSVSTEGDVRPEIFKLARKHGWVLWDLHEEAPRLEDLFHILTQEEATADTVVREDTQSTEQDANQE